MLRVFVLCLFWWKSHPSGSSARLSAEDYIVSGIVLFFLRRFLSSQRSLVGLFSFVLYLVDFRSSFLDLKLEDFFNPILGYFEEDFAIVLELFVQ